MKNAVSDSCGNHTLLWVGIGGGAAVVIGGAVAVALIVRKKRRKAVAASDPEGTWTPDGM